jgi:2-polyprenyl-3-methyl-5-hydroxy-6-metoxy-1,4-benzoquinol methylase
LKNNYKDIIKRQKEFYDSKKKNAASQLWSYFRNGSLNRIKKEVGVEEDIYSLHIEWFGKLSDKKVLDLGCYAGNSLSIYLAQNSKEYLGIDLSPKGINNLNRRLKKIPGARAEVIDFLSDKFKEKDFDLIYAYGVLHHFEDVDQLISKLNETLKEQGQIVSHDPLKTSLPIKFIRTIYRPFQTDKDWEWPFTKNTYYKLENAFNIVDRRAVLGKSKWSFLLNLVPTSANKKKLIAQSWHREDWKMSANSDKYMFSCMHLSLHMVKSSVK